MILATASSRIDNTVPGFNRPVTCDGGKLLYVSCCEAADRHVREYPAPLYAVTFSGIGNNVVLRERTVHFVKNWLNSLSNDERRTITGARRRLSTDDTNTFIDEGTLFAEQPSRGAYLRLYIIPVPVSRLVQVEVFPLDSIKSLGTVRRLGDDEPIE